MRCQNCNRPIAESGDTPAGKCPRMWPGTSESQADCVYRAVNWREVAYRIAEADVDDCRDSTGAWYGDGRTHDTREDAVQAIIDAAVAGHAKPATTDIETGCPGNLAADIATR